MPGDSDGLEDVLCHGAWWDCPRSGVALLRGRPHYFLCEFSETLDDYPPEYRLWPIDQQTLERELAAWTLFATWRKQVDSGISVRPLEENEEFVARNASLQANRVAPVDALVAVPKWRLDSNRSFKERPPQHKAAWVIVRV